MCGIDEFVCGVFFCLYISISFDWTIYNGDFKRHDAQWVSEIYDFFLSSRQKHTRTRLFLTDRETTYATRFLLMIYTIEYLLSIDSILSHFNENYWDEGFNPISWFLIWNPLQNLITERILIAVATTKIALKWEGMGCAEIQAAIHFCIILVFFFQ